MPPKPLVPRTLHIPGVKRNGDLLYYIGDNGITFHPNLTIDRSLLGGIGLFFNPGEGGGNESTQTPQGTIVNSNVKQSFQSVADVELLRIPRRSTFTIHTLVRLLEELKIRDKLITIDNINVPPIKESELIINFLNCMEPTTETHILITYFLAFHTIKKFRQRLSPKSPYYQESPVMQLNTYLNILSATSTIKYPADHFHKKSDYISRDIDDEFVSTYCEMSQKIKLEYESLIEQLHALYHDVPLFDIAKLLSFESYFQICQAVRSRILEIPRDAHNDIDDVVGPPLKKMKAREAQGEPSENAVTTGLQELSINPEEGKSNVGSGRNDTEHTNNTDDYVIDVSLVPILDFVNHNHHSNSYFDIDRRTNDIVLKLRSNVQMIANEKFEVTISYDPELGLSTMPQNEYIEQHIKKHGRRLDYEERKRKKEAREGHRVAKDAQTLKGWRAKQFAKKRYAEKVAMKKKIKAHQESKVKGPSTPKAEDGEALPTYLLDRQTNNTAKAISSSIKQKRLEKADKFQVPLPKVKGISEEEMFKVIKTGKSKSKSWKRMITKHTFVGEGFTRRPVKMERIIRPAALRQKKANVTHPELGVTVFLPILGVKKNPQSPMYTQLGVLTKGTIIEVNVSELGLVTAGGKVVWGKYAQITNEPDRDGCVNAVLLV